MTYINKSVEVPLRRKILLIRQKVANTLNLNTSYSLALISAVLEPLLDVKILDNNGKYKTYSDADILASIKSFKPDIIGFNINMLSYHLYYLFYLVIRCHFCSFYPSPLFL